MQLSFERARARWMALSAAWAVAALLLFAHANVVHDYTAIVSQLGLRGAAAPSTPMKMAFPAFAADAQTWVRHSLSLVEGDQVRLRHTSIDNAPNGREVHWNSAWAWTIAGAGIMDRWLTGLPLPQSIERMTIWLNPFVFLVLIIGLSAWATRRGGALVGVFVVIAMVGHPRVFEGFYPSYIDHHGLLCVAVLGMVLGATFMGCGWWRARAPGVVDLFPPSEQAVNRAAVASALSGAFGMWVSAASTIAPIAIVGASGLASIVLRGRDARDEGLNFSARAWRLWGRTGAGASIFFYLVEYFPNHLGLRLESNHPFYAVAWWGGGELIALISERFIDRTNVRSSDLRRWLLPIVAVLIAPITIIVGGSRVFVVADPFLSALHHTYIQEFLPLWRSIRGTGWSTFFSVVGFENMALLIGAATLVIAGRRCPIVVWFATFAALLFTSMAWMQSRWLLNASGSQVTLALLLVGYFAGGARMAIRWSVGMVAVGLLFLPHAITRITNSRADVQARRVVPKDAHAALSRDIATALRASAPTGDIVLLTSPNASTSVGYYGRFKTLGTLYWENVDGLKAAAAMLSARSLSEAEQLIRKRGVTHIALISEENFIEQYFRLLHPNATEADIKQSLGYQLLVERSIPSWLQMIPYRVPDDLASLNVNVMLFKVAFEQTPAEALYHVALAKVAMGQAAEAERDFDTLINSSPGSHQPWMRKAELLLARSDWANAVTAFINGISRAPVVQRPGLFAIAAQNFYKQNRPAEAVQIYRAALKEHFDENIAAYLAFILATSKDDRLRDGREALALSEKALKVDPTSPTILNSYAAALAENGRYEEAVAAENQAIVNARNKGETAVQRVSEERLVVFRSGKPLRQ